MTMRFSVSKNYMVIVADRSVDRSVFRRHDRTLKNDSTEQ